MISFSDDRRGSREGSIPREEGQRSASAGQGQSWERNAKFQNSGGGGGAGRATAALPSRRRRCCPADPGADIPSTPLQTPHRGAGSWAGSENPFPRHPPLLSPQDCQGLPSLLPAPDTLPLPDPGRAAEEGRPETPIPTPRHCPRGYPTRAPAP